MTTHDDPRPGDHPSDLEILRRWADEALALLHLYVREARAGVGPVLRQRPLADIARDLRLDHWIREGGMDAEALGRFLRAYLADSTRLHHPGYIGHQVAVPLPTTALADLVHGTLNNGMAVYEMGASATAVECAVVDWMLAKVGWRPAARPFADGSGNGLPAGAAGSVPAAAEGGAAAGGVLTHGGSLANLTALLAARAAAVPEAWTDGVPGNLAVLAPSSAHYCIARAVAIMGLGAGALVPIEVDHAGRTRPDRLEAARESALGAGRRVIAVVANAAGTPAGVYDDLSAAADFCEQHGLWLHVDGAHGASALVSPAARGLMAGIERADSLVWDAHKLLGTSALCAAVLVRDARRLADAFRQSGSYLIEESPRDVGVDLIGRTVECTKSSLGLKLFLNLAVGGEAGLASHVDTLFGNARRFHDLVRERQGFELLCPPESNILCFRPADADDGTVAAVRAEVVRRGDFYITRTQCDGRLWLRLTVMNPLTDDATIERLLDQVEAILAGL